MNGHNMDNLTDTAKNYFLSGIAHFYRDDAYLDGVPAGIDMAKEFLHQANMMAYYPAEVFLQAVMGNRVHQCKLGDFYRYGTHDGTFPQDYVKANYWYRCAANRASPTAARALFQMYFDGLLERKGEKAYSHVYWCEIGALLNEPVCKVWSERFRQGAFVEGLTYDKEGYDAAISVAKESFGYAVLAAQGRLTPSSPIIH